MDISSVHIVPNEVFAHIGFSFTCCVVPAVLILAAGIMGLFVRQDGKGAKERRYDNRGQ